jgi:hypothetical protein
MEFGQHKHPARKAPTCASAQSASGVPASSIHLTIIDLLPPNLPPMKACEFKVHIPREWFTTI